MKTATRNCWQKLWKSILFDYTLTAFIIIIINIIIIIIIIIIFSK